MAISFVEAMRGTLRDSSGVEHPVEFHVKAETESLRELGRSQLTGLMRASPWATEAPTEGTLVMSIVPPRLAYHLEFRSTSGERLTLTGAKEVLWYAPVRTMTELHMTLTNESGRALADGMIRFEPRDLAPFLASWLPFSRRKQVALDVERRAVERRLFSSA